MILYIIKQKMKNIKFLYPETFYWEEMELFP